MRARWLAFCQEYVKDFNGTRAAVRAGYAVRGAPTQSSRMLRIANVQAEISRLIAERSMGADEVLLRLGEQARGEYAQYVLLDGTVDIAAMVQDGKAHLIKRIKTGRRVDGDVLVYVDDVEFYDAHAALVDLGKHHKLFTDRIEGGLDKPLTDLMDRFAEVAEKIYGTPTGHDASDSSSGE